MTWTLQKFPRTPHFPGSTGARVRSERVLDDTQVEMLLGEPVVVEEKMDGANLGISFRTSGQPVLQSRGAVIEPGYTAPQFAPCYAWLAQRQDALFAQIGARYTLFGEWLYALHSVAYDTLPDYFLAFDVLDRETSRFLPTERRRQICKESEICQVPLLFEGVLESMKTLQSLLTRSRYGSNAAEGLYVRLEDREGLVLRAKFVRPGWVPPDEVHWSKRPLERNRLAPEPSCHDRIPVSLS